MTAHRRLGLDRDVIRLTMQRHINERIQAAMVDFGHGSSYPVCREYIAREINYASYELRRAQIMKVQGHFAHRHEEYLRLWRMCFHVRKVRLRIGAQSGPHWPDAPPLTPRIP